MAAFLLLSHFLSLSPLCSQQLFHLPLLSLQGRQLLREGDVRELAEHTGKPLAIVALALQKPEDVCSLRGQGLLPPVECQQRNPPQVVEGAPCYIADEGQCTLITLAPVFYAADNAVLDGPEGQREQKSPNGRLQCNLGKKGIVVQQQAQGAEEGIGYDDAANKSILVHCGQRMQGPTVQWDGQQQSDEVRSRCQSKRALFEKWIKN